MFPDSMRSRVEAASSLSYMEGIRKEIEETVKVDLHRHVSGAVTASLAAAVAKKHAIRFPSYDIDVLQELLFSQQSVTSHEEYFSPWSTLRNLFATRESTIDLILGIAEDAAQDNVCYCELRSSPKGLVEDGPQALTQYLAWLAEAVIEAETTTGVILRFVIGIPRHIWGQHSEVDLRRVGKQLIDSIKSFQPMTVVGLDLNGIEKRAAPAFFKEVFAMATDAGIPTAAHAGEMGSASEIEEAVIHLGVKRIGHGLASAQDVSALKLLAETQTTVEVCSTSNIFLSAIPNLRALPIEQFKSAGVPFVICTDNPGRCRTTLTQEFFGLVCEGLLDFSDIKTLTEKAVSACFADVALAERLVSRISGNVVSQGAGLY